jgi:hypothetical protein
MAAASPDRRRSSARAVGIVVSVAVHLGILAALLSQSRWRPPDETPDAIQVELARVSATPARVAARAVTRSASPARGASPPPTKSNSPAEAPPTVREPVIPAPQPAVPVPPVGLSQALRGSLGCAHPDAYGLTASEREDCQLRAARLARAGGNAPVYGLSPARQATFEAEAKRSNLLHEPFLAERPKKGCKPTLTEHDAGLVGKGGSDWTASVACTVRF